MRFIFKEESRPFVLVGLMFAVIVHSSFSLSEEYDPYASVTKEDMPDYYIQYDVLPCSCAGGDSGKCKSCIAGSEFIVYPKSIRKLDASVAEVINSREFQMKRMRLGSTVYNYEHESNRSQFKRALISACYYFTRDEFASDVLPRGLYASCFRDLYDQLSQEQKAGSDLYVERLGQMTFNALMNYKNIHLPVFKLGWSKDWLATLVVVLFGFIRDLSGVDAWLKTRRSPATLPLYCKYTLPQTPGCILGDENEIPLAVIPENLLQPAVKLSSGQ